MPKLGKSMAAMLHIVVEINSRFFVFKDELNLKTAWTKNKDDM